jgi:subfamily B ATP-binding cassette protein MsbA
MRIFVRLLRMLKPYSKLLAISWFCVLIQMIPQVALPLVMENVVDMILVKKSAEALQSIIPILLGLFLIGLVASFGQGYLLPVVGQRLIAGFRVAVFEHTEYLSLNFFNRRQTGEIMSRLMGDIDAVQFVTRQLVELVQRLGFLVIALVMLFFINATLAVMCLLPMPFIVLILKWLGDLIGKRETNVREKVAVVNSLLQEALSGIRVIKAFVMEKYVRKRFEEASRDGVNAAMEVIKVGALSGPVVMSLIAASNLTAILQGSSMVIEGYLTSGQLVAFFLYLSMAIDPLISVSSIYNEWQRSLASTRRVYEILDEEKEMKETPSALEMPAIKGLIELRSVSFAYEAGKPILENIDLEIQPGETVAFVGLSGAGKSTLASLIPRFYDADDGVVMIDSVDIRTVTLRSLRSQIGIVPQDTFLFALSVKDNILIGNRSAKFEEVVEAAKAANAHEFISSLKDGYNTQVGERGVSLSMGQRQRITIARTFLKNPHILILDEATSSLDSESEAAVQVALDRLMRDRTTIVIAHRLSTIRDADRIIVIDDKRIRETGTHEQLMQMKGLYCRLYSAGNIAQLMSQEAAPSRHSHHLNER